ncbi:MAG: thioredoxin family protein [Gammaproteobacteria bacterium]|nr:thioredoxin family protein [Gammaproteobacteria bacterium]
MKNILISSLAITCFVIVGCTDSSNNGHPDSSVYYEVETFPKKTSNDCRKGMARIYDECSNQEKILEAALKKGNETGKTVLLVIGAEWCIWCHVFDKYIKGHSRNFNYKWVYEGDDQQWEMKETENLNAMNESKALNKYVSENFVIAHIENYYAPGGDAVIRKTGYDPKNIKFIPYLISLHKNGKYAAHMLAYNAIPGLEIRHDGGEEFRGFDRNILLAELKKLRKNSK